MKTSARTIIICGMKHCGKSTQGELLAGHLQRKFIDTDTVIERLYRDMNGEKLSCREIFRNCGAEFFRQLEAEAVQSLLPLRKGYIIALGGGVLANQQLQFDELRAWGLYIYIATDSQTAFDRVAANGLPPFLADESDPFAKFRQIYAERDCIFRQIADIIITPSGEDSPEAVNEKIIRNLAESDLK